MRKLAKCVGCTAPALYRHFENKDEVIQAVVSEAYRLFSEYLHRALVGRTPVERFAIAGRSYFDFAMEQTALYEIIYMPMGVLGPHQVDIRVADQSCAIGQFWADRVRELVDDGYLRAGDPQEVSLTLWAHAHGLISLYHRGLLGPITEDDFTNLMTGSFFRLLEGLGTELSHEINDLIAENRNQETPTV